VPPAAFRRQIEEVIMRLSASRLVPTRLVPLSAAAFLAFGGVAMAKVVHLHATLAPAAGVTSHGTGTMTGSYSTVTHRLKWHVKYQHLSGSMTMAHFHGPAQPGQDGPVLVPIISKDHSSPINGSKKITAAQAKTILTGMSYVNIHTKKYPMGEIRGQVEEGK
jgi:hypothetical protein